MKRLVGGLAAVVLFSSLAGTAFAGTPSTVGIRIEGSNGTIVAPTTVATSDTPVSKAGATCPGTSAASALDKAVGGDWDGDTQYGTLALDTIRGETHTFSDGHGVTWGIYIRQPGHDNWEMADHGICEEELQQGEQVYIYAACTGASPDRPCYGEPVVLDAPATVAPGQPFAVKVSEVTTTFGGPPDYTQTKAYGPSSGATVTGGNASVTTGADGTASLTLTERGPVTLKATKGNRAPFTATVCVTDGADGYCGTQKPCATDGHDGLCGTRDTDPPILAIDGIRDGQTFTAANAPRQLRGTAGAGLAVARQAGAAPLRQDPSGILVVKLRLTRNDGGRCSYFSGRRETFRKVRCGASHGFWFKVGSTPQWSYLLPRKLPRGRYVLDVNAVDGAGNRADKRLRNVNRVVFHVR